MRVRDRKASPARRLAWEHVAVVLVMAVGVLLHVGDGLSGAAAYIRTLGQAEANPLTAAIVGAGGVAALFCVKALLVAIATAVTAVLPPRYGLLVAAVLAIAGAYGIATNVQNLDQQVDVRYWIDLLHSG